MKKLFNFGFAAFIIVSVLFTSCEQDVTGGNAPSSNFSTGLSVAKQTASVGAPPNQWTQITDPVFTNTFTNVTIQAVNYGATGQSSPASVFVAGGTKGAAAYSPDGVSWTTIPNVTAGQTIYGIANDGSGTFIMVADGSYLAYTNNILSGQWTTLDASDTHIISTIYAVAYGELSGRFVIGGYGGSAAYSDDGGAAWTQISELLPIFTNANSNIRAIASYPDDFDSGDDFFLAVGGRSGMAPMPNAAAYSTSNGDINTWKQTKNGIFCRGLTVNPNVYDPTLYFVAAGYDMENPVNHNIAYINPYNLDFSMWVQVPTTTTNVPGWLDCIAYGGIAGQNNGYFVAGGVDAQISYTTNLANWTPVKVTGFTSYVDGICYGDVQLGATEGRFVAVGDNGIGAYTTNGVFTKPGPTVPYKN
jgi:hypothetical protein